MDHIEDIYLIEVNVNHSKEDNPFTYHISTLKETMKIGRDCVFRGKENNCWYIIDIAFTYKEASEKCNKAKEIMEKLEYEKKSSGNFFLTKEKIEKVSH